MAKKLVQNLEELKDNFENRLRGSGRSTAILAGHFALESDRSLGSGLENTFGAFPELTWTIGVGLVSFAKKQGRECKLVLVIDDHSLMQDRQWYSSNTEESLRIRDLVEKRFAQGVMPPRYLEILSEYNLNETDLIVPDLGSGLIFQESKYREKFMQTHQRVDLGCAGEFRLIAEEIARKGYSQLLGFIPMRCQGPTCSAIDTMNTYRNQGQDIPDLKAVLAYLPTSKDLYNKEELETEAREKLGGFSIISI